MATSDPATPIDRIFSRLAATYCASWDRSLGQAPLMDVKTAWAHELAGFMQSRSAMMAVAWALENLPERCPNVIEFRNLCRMAPAAEAPALPEPKADPERLRAELAKLAPLREQFVAVTPKDCKAWAMAIMANPAGRTPTVLQMARNAVGVA